MFPIQLHQGRPISIWFSLIILATSAGCASLFGTGGGYDSPRDRYDISDDRVPGRGDVAVGMSTNDVRRNWGEPRRVYSAGTHNSGHQKWVYTEGPTSSWGMSPTRTVYFEGNRVVGWETQTSPLNY